MSVNDESKLIDLLKSVSNDIKNFIDQGKSNRTLLPLEEQYMKWKLAQFEYADSGVNSTSATGQYLTRKVWWNSYGMVLEYIKKSKSYQDLEKKIQEDFPAQNLHVLESFTNKIMSKCFNEEKIEFAEIENIINIFIKDLKNEPVKCGIIVELTGIAIRSKSIQIDPWIILRQTEIADLEKEIPISPFSGFGGFPHSAYPSAILKIEQITRNPSEIQHKEWKIISILKLFKIGSIRPIKSQMYSESIITLFGGIAHHSLEIMNTPQICLIKEGDEGKLKQFYQQIERKIPFSFFESSTSDIDFKTISYKRYEEALFQDGTIEKGIANGIMGLESLFLRGGEVQELSYRLRFRVARLVSFFGYDPLDVKKTVTDAYNVRNQYVHGGLLSYDAKKDLDEKYHDIKNLLMNILDYLRLSIISFIMINVSKDELIDTIDKSFIDDKSLKKLEGILTIAKNLVLCD